MARAANRSQEQLQWDEEVDGKLCPYRVAVGIGIFSWDPHLCVYLTMYCFVL